MRSVAPLWSTYALMLTPNPEVKERIHTDLKARSGLSAHQSALDLPRCIGKFLYSHAQSIIAAEGCRHLRDAENLAVAARTFLSNQHKIHKGKFRG